jgi:hypothetical protein
MISHVLDMACSSDVRKPWRGKVYNRVANEQAVVLAKPCCPDSFTLQAIGITGNPAQSSFQSWITAAKISTYTVNIVNSPTVLLGQTNGRYNIDFSTYRIIYVPSSYYQTQGGITNQMSGRAGMCDVV